MRCRRANKLLNASGWALTSTSNGRARTRTTITMQAGQKGHLHMRASPWVNLSRKWASWYGPLQLGASAVNGRNHPLATGAATWISVGRRWPSAPRVVRHTLLFDARHNPNDQEGRRLVDKFAYLDQDQIVTCALKSGSRCSLSRGDPDTNDQNSEQPENETAQEFPPILSEQSHLLGKECKERRI